MSTHSHAKSFIGFALAALERVEKKKQTSMKATSPPANQIKPLLNRAAARRLMKSVCEEWQIHRRNFPRALMNQIEADCATLITRMVIGHATGTRTSSPPPRKR